MNDNKYFIENMVEKLERGMSTEFLMPSEIKQINYKKVSKKYNIYYPYKESDKVILYGKEIPLIKLYEIKTNNEIRHQDILGSLFNMGVSNNSFGDIIVTKGKNYIYILPKIERYLLENWTQIGKEYIELVEVDLDSLEDYEKEYDTYETIVASLRLDIIVGQLTNEGRNNACEKIENKNVIVNYEVQTKKTYMVKENDVISIRKYGKFKFIGVKKITQKQKMVIEYIKYK